MARNTTQICVVDPNEPVRDALRSLLSDLEVIIEEFDTAENFLKELVDYQASPACLIVELSLPDMSGLELFHRVHSQGILLPTVMLATRNDVSSAVSAIRAGVAEFYEKPFPAASLHRAVEKIVCRYDQQDAQPA